MVQQDVEMFNVEKLSFAFKTDIDLLAQSFDLYAPLHHIDEIKEELKTKANQYDFNGVYFSIDAIKKEMESVLSKEQFRSKYTELRTELERKISEKLNIAYLKKLEIKYEGKFENIGKII